MTDIILEARDLKRVYPSGSRILTVLDEINFKITRGSTCAVTGPSGSGKTTLLGLCAGLDKPTSGTVILNDIVIDKLGEDERAKIRNRFVGFIFQTFNLMPTLTALENVMIPLELRGEKNIRSRALSLLDKVGLADRYTHYPAQLSGGEQQRVSIARAFSNEPQLMFADEPTGNLDQETGANIEKLIFDLNREHQTTLIMVTHDLELASKTERVMQMKGGKIINDFMTNAVPSGAGYNG